MVLGRQKFGGAQPPYPPSRYRPCPNCHFIKLLHCSTSNAQVQIKQFCREIVLDHQLGVCKIEHFPVG